MDDSELWVSDEDEQWGEDDDEAADAEDPALFFTLEMERQGQQGGYHVYNLGKIQRKEWSGYESGSKKKPAFRVSCKTKAIVHGTLDPKSGQRATLFVHDFSFFSYRSTRIKSAEIMFNFMPKEGSDSTGPTVKALAPYATHMMMWTPETDERTRTWEVSGDAKPPGGVGGLGAKAGGEGKITKTTTHAAEVTGDNPFDDMGNYCVARWDLQENNSQENGIVRQLRTCVLVTRNDDAVFACAPFVKATPNFSTWVGDIFSTRPKDEPVLLDPSYEPYNELEGVVIDPNNLGAVDMNYIWDCTFRGVFGGALKDSRSRVEVKITSDGSVEKVDEINQA